jgi:hypothetical protein
MVGIQSKAVLGSKTGAVGMVAMSSPYIQHIQHIS